MNEWFFRNKDLIGFGMILIVCLLMVFAHIREGSSLLNVGKWFIVIGLTIVLMIRNSKKKKARNGK